MTTPRTALAALLVAAAALTACGSTDAGSPSTVGSPAGAASGSPAAASSSTSYPVSVTNCGRTLTFDKAPERIVSAWPTNTELLIELGAGDRVVGHYNTSTGTPSAKNAAAYAGVKVLSPQTPTREVLLAARPDMIWADGSYAFDGKTLPTIAELADLGVQVMILSGFCGKDATAAKITDVTTDATALGTVLGVPDRAAALTRTVQDRLAAVKAKTAGKAPVPVLFLSTYDKALYTYEGVYSDIATLAGGTNLYAGKLPKGSYFGQVSAEAVTKLDPAVVVYLTTGDQTPEQAQAEIRTALPTIKAVAGGGTVIALPQNDSTNLRGVTGVETLAAALHP